MKKKWFFQWDLYRYIDKFGLSCELVPGVSFGNRISYLNDLLYWRRWSVCFSWLFWGIEFTISKRVGYNIENNLYEQQGGN